MRYSATPVSPASSSASASVDTSPVRSMHPALAGLCLTMLMPSLATSVANAALPTFARTFSASFQATQWIVLIYLLAVTVAVVVVGQIGDVHGRRRTLLAGIAMFTASSLLCSAAPTLPLLIAARGLQGAGAAMMMALSMAFVGDVVARARIGQAMGLLGTMSAIGTMLGPSLGGFLIALVGWPAIFLVNVPLGVLAWLLLRASLPEDARANASAARDFDFAGLILFPVALGAYTLAVTLGRGQFGPLNLGLLLLALGAGASFMMVEAKVASPLIQLSIFRKNGLAPGFVASALVSTVMMTTLVVGPFYLSGAMKLDAAMLGLLLSAGPFVATIAGVPAGRFVDRFGIKRMTVVGLVVVLTGAVAFSLIPESVGVVGYILPLVTMTGGYAIFQAANNTAIMHGALLAQRGVVAGMLGLSRNLGLMTGASVMGAVFALGVGADVMGASPSAIANGMRTTFAVASILVAVSLTVAIRTRSVGEI